jgi:hypothetical protein
MGDMAVDGMYVLCAVLCRWRLCIFMYLHDLVTGPLVRNVPWGGSENSCPILSWPFTE